MIFRFFAAKLARRLVLLMLLAAVPASLCGILLLTKVTSATLTESSHARLAATARDVESKVGVWTTDAEKDLEFLCRNSDVVSMDPKRQRTVLLELRKTYLQLSYAHTLGPDGIDTARADDLPLIDYSDRAYFKRVMAGEGIVHQVLGSTRSTGHSGLTLAGPIIGLDGKVLGVVVVGTDLSVLGDVVGAAHYGKTGYSCLVDEKGRALAHPNLQYASSLEDLSDLPPVAGVITTRRAGAYRFEDKHGVWWLAQTVPISNGWSVISFQEEDEVLAGAHRICLWAIVIMIGTVTVNVSFMLFAARRVVRPITQMTSTAGLIAGGQWHRRIPEDRHDEVGSLAHAFNQMVGELEQMYRSVEAKVKDRTIELEALNVDLQAQIEDTRRAEAGAESLRRRNDSILSSAGEGIVGLDLEGKVTFVNPAGARMLGWDAQELIGKDLHDLIHRCPRAQCQALGTLRSGQTRHVSEDEYWRKDGTAFPVDVIINPIREGGQIVGLVGSFTDMTEQRKAREALVDARKQAEAATRAKSDFLANMSHEIRTPMTAILGYSDLLADPTLNASERLNHLGVIRRNGDHLMTLINDILDLSKIEAGRMAIETRKISLVSAIAEVASILRTGAQQRGIELSVRYDTPVPEMIESDDSRVRQILLNLVGNAVKFTERGEVKILISYLPTWKDQGGIRIKVSDTGIGMEERKLARLFEPFMQADASTSRKYGGTGLGLAVSRRIATLLGAELSVVSVLGMGSIFTFVVPVGCIEGVALLEHPQEAVAGQNAATVQTADPQALAGLHVLLAEDGVDNQRLIVAFLQKAGAAVQVAANGRIAVQKVQAAGLEAFDVILMDMQMPDMDGYQATRALRELGCNRPILALTAHAMTGDREKCIQAGCDEHLAKPISRTHLIATVAKYGPPKPDGVAGTAVPGEAAPAGQSPVSPQAPAGQAPTTELQTLPSDADPTVIGSQFADDPDLAEILDQFIAGLGQTLADMRSALSNNHMSELRRLAHQLKGAGGSYGYPMLTSLAKILEDQATAGDLEAAKLALHQLNTTIQAIARGHCSIKAEG